MPASSTPLATSLAGIARLKWLSAAGAVRGWSWGMGFGGEALPGAPARGSGRWSIACSIVERCRRPPRPGWTLSHANGMAPIRRLGRRDVATKAGIQSRRLRACTVR